MSVAIMYGDTVRALERIYIYTKVDHTARREVVKGIGRYAKARGDWQPSIPWDDLDHWVLPEGARPAGVIAFPQTVQEMDFLTGLKVPVVVAGPHFREAALPRVEWDDEAAGAMAAAHLADTGMGALAFVGSDLGKNYLAARARGARAEATRRGLEFESFDLEPGGHQPEKLTAAAGRARKWLAERREPSGIVAGTDHNGLTLLAAARAAEIDIPGQLAMVGIGGDNLLCAFSEPPLSSVILPGEEVGYEAGRMLADLIDGKPVENRMIPPRELKMRSSSDVVVCEDELVGRALRFIRDHADKPTSVADVLAVVPLSRRPLELRFKRATGRTLQKEIWRAHIARARRLLLETDLSVAEIAYQSGFTEPQRMTEVFTRELGIPPGKVRTDARPGFRS